MRKATREQIVQKREEIINACEQLYQKMSFREITLKEIGNITSFSRPTIYNYFETKENWRIISQTPLQDGSSS